MELFQDNQFGYVCGVMTIYFSAAVDPDGAIYASAVRSLDGKKLMKYGYFMVIRAELY